MKFNESLTLKNRLEEVNNIEPEIKDNSRVLQTEDTLEKSISVQTNSKSIRVSLTEEEKKLTGRELAEKYNLTDDSGYLMKRVGSRSVANPNYISSNELKALKMQDNINFLKETTPIEIQSIESSIGNEDEQRKVKEVINLFEKYKYNSIKIDRNDIYNKRFKLLNGQELTFGDFMVLDKAIKSKMFRNQDGVLMVFDNDENKFIPFKRSSFLTKRGGLKYKKIEDTIDDSRHRVYSLESLAPNIFKTNLFNEKDFDFNVAGSPSFEIYGPHERKLKQETPNVFLSNSDTSAKYYIGRDKFSGKDKKINYETVKISLLDDNTGVVTDIINGRKIILYTFPLISKEEYENKKEEIKNRRIIENKTKNINANDYITKTATLKEYSITDYIFKNENESDKDYIEKISRLSDTSYVLGNFKSFMSDTGLAANNYSWREQLVLADTLTSIESKDKIINFGKIFKKNGMRTFLSIEQGGKEMGDKIIELGDKLPEKIAQKVFAKYGEIIDNVSKITEFTRTNFTKEIETNPELIKKIEETLYIKGKQLLSQTYDDINSKREINYEDIGKQLDRINADTITTFAIFKQALKNGEKLPIESIEGSVFSKKEATDINENQQSEMLELYESNWKNHPDHDFVESLKIYFKTAFAPEDNKQKNYFYTFEKDNNIRAFVRFEKQKNKSFYASALNVDEASKNFGLGEAMMDEALTREAKEHVLHASCRKDNPSNMRYFEKGFISQGFKKTNETEEFDLVWDESKNKDILAKQKSQEELINMYRNLNTVGIEIKKSKDLESLNNIIPDGKSLVRCFVNNGEWYAIYEVISEDYGMNLGETK